MKRTNMFTRLPQADQTLVLDLSAKLPYHAVVEQLAKPRAEGGLSMTTSESSLSKFFTRHDRDAVALQAIGNYATAVQVNQQAHGEANFEAIMGLVQNRILTSLRDGKSVADLDKDFRSLQRVQNCFLADNKYRKGNERTQEAYLGHVKVIAPLEDEAEFIDNTLENDPGAGFATKEDFQEEPNQLQRDIEYARTALPTAQLFRNPTFLRTAARIVAARTAAQHKETFLRTHNVNPAFALPELDPDTVTPAGLLKLQRSLPLQKRRDADVPTSLVPCENSDGISSVEPSKTPAISHISPNFASPDFAKSNPSQSHRPPPDARLV